MSYRAARRISVLERFPRSHRRHSALAGRLHGSASVKLFLPVRKMNCPEIANIPLPPEGLFHNLLFVSMRKTYPMQAYKSRMASGAWAR